MAATGANRLVAGAPRAAGFALDDLGSQRIHPDVRLITVCRNIVRARVGNWRRIVGTRAFVANTRSVQDVADHAAVAAAGCACPADRRLRARGGCWSPYR